MDFVSYLNAKSLEIYQLVSQKTAVAENSPACKKHDIFGFYSNASSRLIICTERILSYDNPAPYVNQTLLREATHLAQACRLRMKSFRAFGMARGSIQLTGAQEQDLAKVVRMHGRIVEDLE
jgi:hypothetical protein